MFKLILNDDTVNFIPIDSFNESFSSKYGIQRHFSANGAISLQVGISPLDILQNANNETLTKISILDSDNQVIWFSSAYKDIENSNISIGKALDDENNIMNFSVSFSM